MMQDLDSQFEAEIFRTLQAARADNRVPAWSDGPCRVGSAARRQRRLQTLASGLGAVVLLGGLLVGVVVANHQPRQPVSGATGEEPTPGITTASAATSPYANRMKPARVVASGDPKSSNQAITIDLGSHDGVHINMTVVTDLGLVGNVVRVGETTAMVQLLTDPGITVTVKNSRTNVQGFVQGRADGRLDLTQISQTSDIRIGDKLVTYGSEDNQPYVPNVPVGEVTSVDNIPGAATHTAIIRPFASFKALDIVAVIFAPATPRRHVFISPITPAPTTTPPSPT